jgi:hypothetical protein
VDVPAPSFAVAPAAPRVSARRLLGALGMLASPAFLVQWLASNPFAATRPRPRRAAGQRVRPRLPRRVRRERGRAAPAARHRRGRGAAVLFAVQMVGLALAASQDLQDLAGVKPLGAAAYSVTDVAWPLSHVFMLAVFAAVWRARVWTGWRRWTPLACGSWCPR